MSKTLFIIVLMAFPARLTGAQQETKGSLPPAEQSLARDLLRELVEIDTTPQKGSTRAAEAMATRLRSAGFDAADVQLLGPRADRMNLVVRLRGSGAGKPILLMAHLDTVDAPREGWNSDPLQLTERDGFLYGRGVNDCKHEAANLVANLIRLRRERYVPSRDIVVALTADEETGTANGVAWLLRQHRDLLDVEFCLNLDGGGGIVEKGRRCRVLVETSQKFAMVFRAETKGVGGHPSMPEKDNAILRLAAGLTRLGQYQFPFRFNETTRMYFARLAEHESGALAVDMRAAAQEPPDLAAAQRLADRSAFHNAILHTAYTVMRIEGGQAGGGLPETASVTILCKVFPGDSPEFVRSSIEAALADRQIKLTVTRQAAPCPVAPLRPDVMNAIEQQVARIWPGIPVVPVLAPWSSDCASLLRAGLPAYGVSAMFADEQNGTHGTNERLPVDAFYDGVDYLYGVLKTLTATPSPAAKN